MIFFYVLLIHNFQIIKSLYLKSNDSFQNNKKQMNKEKEFLIKDIFFHLNSNYIF